MLHGLGRRKPCDRRLSNRLAIDDCLGVAVARGDVLAAGRRGNDAALRFVVRRKLLAGRRRAGVGDGLVAALGAGVWM